MCLYTLCCHVEAKIGEVREQITQREYAWLYNGQLINLMLSQFVFIDFRS